MPASLKESMVDSLSDTALHETSTDNNDTVSGTSSMACLRRRQRTRATASNSTSLSASSTSDRRDGGGRDGDNNSSSSSLSTPIAQAMLLSDTGSLEESAATSLSSPQTKLSLFETNIPRLCVALLASMTTGGTVYAFGLYGNALKRNLHLTQSELDTISTALFCAGALSWIPGLLVDYFGTRFGISMGGVIGAAALMVYWYVANHGLDAFEGMGFDSQSPNQEWIIIATLSALSVTIFLSCALITGSVFKIIVNSCGPGTKGSAVGVAKGYVGLGSGVYAALFEAIRQPKFSDLEFIPMCAFFFIVAATIPALCLLPTKKQEEERRRRRQPDQQRQETAGPQRAEQDLPPSGVPDVTTPTHYRLLFSSLILMACVIVGNALITLYHSAKEEKYADDDDVFPGKGDDAFQYPSNDVGGVGPVEDYHGPNYLLAIFLLVVWMGPIASVACLPRGTQSVSTVEIIGDEQETLLDTVGQDATNRINNTKQDSNEIAMTDGSASDILQMPTEASDPLIDEENHSDHGAVSHRNGDDSSDKNLAQMLMTPAAWLMLFSTTILVGGGTVETNNLGQMVESLHFHDIVTPAAMALFSVAQSLARAATGAVSESALSNWNTHRCGIDNGVPRPFFLVVASLAGFVAHFLLAVSTTLGAFVVGIFLSGAAFGMVWPLMVLIVGEVFGTAHVAANYMFFDGFTSACGTLLLSKMVAQEVYERHIPPPATDVDTTGSIDRDQAMNFKIDGDIVVGGKFADGEGKTGDNLTCYGHECFQETHVVIAALSLLCVVTSIIMQYNTRHHYNKSCLHRH